METTQYMNERELRILAETYDSVYLHPVYMITVMMVAAVLGAPSPLQREWTGSFALSFHQFPSGSSLSLQNSYNCACLASGSVLRLVDAMLGGEIRNAMAVIR